MYKVYRKFTSLKRTIIARSLHLYCVGAINSIGSQVYTIIE